MSKTMSGNGIRVVLASEQPRIRGCLGSMVKQKLGGVVVGEGENAVRALSLTRQLRPDMVLIDSYLPHSLGLTDIPLSRNAGLDAAQAIAEEIPDVQVVLVDTAPADNGYAVGEEDFRLEPPLSGNGHDTAAVADRPGIAFTSLQAGPGEFDKSGFGTICFTLGAIGLVVGSALIATMFMAYAGLPLLMLGILSLLIGAVDIMIGLTRARRKKRTLGG